MERLGSMLPGGSGGALDSIQIFEVHYSTWWQSMSSDSCTPRPYRPDPAAGIHALARAATGLLYILLHISCHAMRQGSSCCSADVDNEAARQQKLLLVNYNLNYIYSSRQQQC
jgi:hypothetical protein